MDVWAYEPQEFEVQEVQVEPPLLKVLPEFAEQPLVPVPCFADCVRLDYPECVPHAPPLMERVE